MHIFIKELGVLGTNGIVGGGLPLSLGPGIHAKLQKSGQVTVCFFSDGAANQGTFHESVNLAAVQQLPVVFVCENNSYATATRVDEVTLTKNFADRAAGYGIPGRVVNGNDVLDVYANSLEAVQRARSGKGPTLLECKTYRHFGHYVGENTSYRSQKEVDEWIAKDPIKLFKKHLLQENLMEQAEIEQTEKEVLAEIEQAKEFALQSPLPDPAGIEDYVFFD